MIFCGCEGGWGGQAENELERDDFDLQQRTRGAEGQPQVKTRWGNPESILLSLAAAQLRCTASTLDASGPGMRRTIISNVKIDVKT